MALLLFEQKTLLNPAIDQTVGCRFGKTQKILQFLTRDALLVLSIFSITKARLNPSVHGNIDSDLSTAY